MNYHLSDFFSSTNYRSYLITIISIAFVTIGALAVHHLLAISPVNVVMIYLLLVVIIALKLNFYASILASFLGVVTFDFFFIPPQLTFAVTDVQYIITFIGLFIVGIIIANLVATSRNRMEAIKQREQETFALYLMSRELLSTIEIDDVIQVILDQIKQIMDCDAAIILCNQSTISKVYSTRETSLNDLELIAACKALRQQQPSGVSTNLCSAASGYYYPFTISPETSGILGFFLDEHFLSERKKFVYAFIAQATLAIEASHLATKAKRAEIFHEKEILHTTILNSISHDLRTPLVSITGTLSYLRDEINRDDDLVRYNLVQGAYEEANRLNRLVSNLLEMSRLQAGSRLLKRELYDVFEVISIARSQLKDSLDNRKLVITVEDDLPLISVDLTLFSLVLINLLDNATKYSAPDTAINIRAYQEQDIVYLEVEDSGIGISEEQLPHIFERFYRAATTNGKPGSGLGLPICKGIIDLHEGTIQVHSSESGTRFTVSCS